MNYPTTLTARPSIARQVIRALSLALLIAFLLLVFSFRFWIDGTGPYHNATALADLDGDGDLDVLLNNLRYENNITLWAGVTLWYNQGNGRFTPVKSDRLLAGHTPLSAAGVDIDQDGDTDLLGVDNNRLALIFQQDDQYRAAYGVAPPGYFSQFRAVTPGDLNGDGQVDGFVAGCCGMAFPAEMGEDGFDPPTSFAWINDWNPRGWVERHALPVAALDGLAVRGAALADLDADGDLDVFATVQHGVAGHDLGAADRVLLNDGAGNLTDSEQRINDGDSYSVALGDLNGDGSIDALVGTPSGAEVWMNQRNATFVPRQPDLPGGEGLAVFLADLDGDSDLDALVAGARQASIWRNDGAGNFTRDRQRFNYTRRHAVALADFNHDGYADIFAAAYDENYRLWLNDGKGGFRAISH